MNKDSYKFQYIQQSIIVPVYLVTDNGKTLQNFILDTGTNKTTVDAAFPKIFKLESNGSSQIITNDVHKEITPTFEMEIAVINENYAKKLTVSTDNMISYSRNIGIEIGGILGTDYLKDYIVSIDYKNQIISFLKQAGIKINNKLLAEVTFQMMLDLPIIEFTLPDKTKGLGIIDTGQVYDLDIYDDLGKQLKLAEPIDKRMDFNAAGFYEIVDYKLEFITIGDLKIENITLSIFPLLTKNSFDTEYKPGLLGQPIFERYLIEIDFLKSSMRFYANLN